MKRILKWAAIVIGILVVGGFFAFLYFIPPFTLAPPEAFSGPELAAAPRTGDIADAKERLIAEHGRYLVVTRGCTGCHTPSLPNGAPNDERYLAGGNKLVARGEGTVHTRNLTPDMETGLGARSREEIMTRLRTGQFQDGRLLIGRAMPWPIFSNLTDEDRYAIATYLKHLKPIRASIPDLSTKWEIADTAAAEAFIGGDFARR
jgi:mono/diheme cytochrome c family protein